MTKFVFITGGVVSGIGKGITSASLGLLLKSRGLKVVPVKVDPYLNRDAGTMNPFQHGEVFVTDDGAETDLDLGHYERFMDVSLSKTSNFTTGSIYESVMHEERRGGYLGKTIQVIPHVTDEIKRRIRLAAKDNPDVVIVEIGGTVGDIEAQPFLEAIRQFRQESKPMETVFIHVVKIDYVYPSDEEKTKPIQQSVSLLRSFGIQPDMLVVRCKRPFNNASREKIALFAGIGSERVISASDATNIYEVPIKLEKGGLAKQVIELAGIKGQRPDLKAWQQFLRKASNPKHEVTLGFVGKYLNHPDAYLSVVEALHHAAVYNNVKLKIKAIDSESKGLIKELKSVSGVLVPGGFGTRGIEGKIKAVNYVRENKLPYLGLCLGLQVAVIEYARNILGLKNANSTEFDKNTPQPVVDFIPEQKKIQLKGGTMRLGSYQNKLQAGSLIAQLYGGTKISERHRHRFEVNPKYHKALMGNGLVISGWYGDLAEFIELPFSKHPFFVATQAHPEFKSRPNRPSPLFNGFIKVMIKKTSKR